MRAFDRGICNWVNGPAGRADLWKPECYTPHPFCHRRPRCAGEAFVPERVFALLKNLFGDAQMSALADYIQAALMLNYNGRVVG